MVDGVQSNNGAKRNALHSWRDSLLSLTGRNRLLNYRPTRSSTIDFIESTPDEVIRIISTGKGVPVAGITPTPPPLDADAPSDELEEEALADIEETDFSKFPNHLFAKKTQRDVDRGLRLLATTATREYLDRGLSVLYLALGAMHWVEANGDPRVSPLIFIPVELRTSGPKQPHRLYPSSEDAVVNPALEIKMREHGITLPTQTAVDSALAEGGYAGAEALFAALPLPSKWSIQPLCVLSIFMFAKEAMYRDLEANEEAILQSALIGGLTGRDQQLREQLTFEPIDPSTIDDVSPPETTPLILDADSSQRVAIAATEQGRSFVLDGPPGTGKSQTISNIIATLMASGKRVLFVSEKAVALDVVRDRLTHRGLGPLLFELHSHKAARSEVAQNLGRALSSRPSVLPQTAPSPARAKTTREELTGYAAAMNERRQPIEWTLFEVLGKTASLPDVSSYPPALVDTRSFTEAQWNEICDLADAVRIGWSHIAQRDRHPWYGITRIDGLEFDLTNARRALNRLVDTLDAVAPDRSSFGLDSLNEWKTVLALTDLWHRGEHEWRDSEWLAHGPSAVLDEARSAIAKADQFLNRDSQLSASLGPAWRTFASRDATRTLPPEADAVVPNLFTQPAADLAAQVAKMGAVTHAARASQDCAESIARSFGLPMPRFASDHRVLDEIAGLVVTGPQLRVDWLSADGITRLRAALSELHSAQIRAAQSGEAASAYFRDSIATADISSIAERWDSRNALSRSVLGPTRSDKDALMPHASTKLRTAMAHLGLAAAWQQSLAALNVAAQRVHDLLGWVPSDEERWALASAQVERAAAVVTRVGTVPGSSAFSPSSGEHQRAELTRSAASLRRAVDFFSQSVEQAGSREFVESRSIEESLATLDAVGSAVSTALDATSLFAADGTRSLNAAWDLQDSAHATAITARETEEDLRRISTAYPGIESELSRESVAKMAARLAWTSSVLALIESAGPEARLRGLSSLAYHPDLAVHGAAWDAARGSLLGRFVGREVSLSQELSDADDAEDLLVQLTSSIGDADALSLARSHFDALTRQGAGAVLDELLERADVDDVSDVIRASVLSAWMSAHIDSDPRLRAQRPVSRAALVELFRDLDRGLVENAAAQILAQAIARRPSVASSQTALIQGEAQKKRRHIPVRDLIGRAGDVIQAIHPCFMMSPLAVSQYLPADIRFDYVIFDEASQIPPADAINCLYRASAVIAAGDQKQLPPTSFFSATQQIDESADDEEDLATDYESLLDLMKSSGSYTSIGLRWHYRSRHEHLIAYSNSSFYEDSLVTFPGAFADVPDAGVKLLKVDGIYRRSQGQDNPLEARYVAERVIHHLDSRPGKSVGVVAMSAAQRDAISNALQVLRGERPDLENSFAESRLDGIFVKSLEEVQGDERDVMIMSIGYGPDDSGTVYKNFGPINKKGGERRLNVAITRAKELTEVVSSMSAGDIGDIPSAGGRHLRRYLDYAERGPAALSIELGPEGLGTDSPFEDAVISSIRSWGYDVQPQVGVSGFRIDIGVKHPSAPGVFMLGVECDGAMYHSAQSARDRDRLRHDILVGLGWRIHHIWGTDWYRNRSTEEAKLRDLLQQLEAEAPAGRLGGRHVSAPAVVLVEETPDLVAGTRPEWVMDYAEASGLRLRALDWTESYNAPHLVDFVRTVAEAEAPVHVDTLKARLRAESHIDRVNKRALRTLEAAIELSELPVDGDFVLVAGAQSRPVRTAGGRSTSQVHESEFSAAIERLIGSMAGATRADLVLATSRAFGWMRTPNDLAVRVSATIDRSIATGRFVEDGGVVRLA